MNPRLAAFLPAASVFALDRVTKWWVEQNLVEGQVVEVVRGVFNLVLTRNTGIAFGVFSDGEGEWRSVLVGGLTAAVMVLLMVALWRGMPAVGELSRLTRLSFSLVLGGAGGNLYDRVAQGAVTDFLDFHAGRYHWPAFNVADAAISVGIGLLLADLWFFSKRREER